MNETMYFLLNMRFYSYSHLSFLEGKNLLNTPEIKGLVAPNGHATIRLKNTKLVRATEMSSVQNPGWLLI